WRTLDWARALGTSVNAYQCLALPDALLDRATGDDRYDVDPTSFALRRAPGWTEAALEATRARLDVEARTSGDTRVAGVWHFPATRRRRPASDGALGRSGRST
ncbi:MAG TPA: hypothetical protein VL400_01170, partial [Polyangiaceae bacterium]|nr:hypothetical protein [Polyangiaceae bacterium]